jgi:hypothetical protein
LFEACPDETDPRDFVALPMRSKRPCCRRTANKRDEFAPPHMSPPAKDRAELD